MLNDVRHALRLLVRQPGFTVVACLTLALGIGANTAVFSVVDAALFRPLPYQDADRLVSVYRIAQARDGQHVPVVVDGNQVDLIRAVTPVFERVEVFKGPVPLALASGIGQTPWVGGYAPGLPSLLGVAPEVGRTFAEDDVRGQATIVLSDGFWRHSLGADPSVVGKTIAFASHAYVVIGVMPPSFRYFAGAAADAWLPIGERDGTDLAARLCPGVTIEQAKRTLDAETSRMRGKPLEWLVERAGTDRVQRPARVMLLSLLGAVAFVLLIACANVANLLLARTLTRQRELAIRISLGATRAQVVRQFLIEGIVLSALGGIVATLAAWWAVRAVPGIIPGKLIQSLLGASLPSVDLRVLAFGAGSTILTGLCCGIVPALRTSGSNSLGNFIAGGGRVAGPSRAERRLRGAFQALQFALTIVLLIGAGLLIGTFVRLVDVPLGFDADKLMYVDLSVPAGAFAGDPQQFAFASELAAHIGSLPGVRGAAVGQPPAAGGTNAGRLWTDDASGNSILARTEWFFVDRAYFDVAGIPLERGRPIGPQDRAGSPPVVIVSDNLARRLWPNRDPIGQRLMLGTSQPYEVIGVVPHLKTIDVANDNVQVFLSAAQLGRPTSLIFRASVDPSLVADAVRLEARALNPYVTVRRIGTVEDFVRELDPLGSPRLYAVLMGTLAGLGLLTAAVGLFGLLSHAVSQRTREIGVRIALGAGASRVRALVIRTALVPLAIGTPAGLVASIWLSRLLASQLFHVTPHDPVTFAIVTAVLIVACAIALVVPTIRATRVDPVDALRAE